MIEEQATVIKCDEQYVWVETQRKSSCGHCSVKNGCGTHVLSKVLGNKLAQVRCLNVQMTELSEGDKVVIGLKESSLLNGSLLIYLLPLLVMIVFAGLAVYAAKIWWPDAIDLLSIMASIAGLLLGLSMARYFTRHSKQHTKQHATEQGNKSNINRFEPVILRKLPVTQWQCKIEL